MMGFRVSEHEFELLKTQSEAEGARSVSDFAGLPSAVTAGHPEGRRNDIHKLKDEIEQFDTDVRRVTELLERASRGNACDLTPVRRKTGGA